MLKARVLAPFVPAGGEIWDGLCQGNETPAAKAEWALHEPPGDSADHDEELYVRGNTVVWSAGAAERRVCRKVYAVDGPVLQALWCHLPEPLAFGDEVAFSEADARTLCVVEVGSLSLFAATGATFSVPLPFKAARVYPLAEGLLIFRDTSAPMRHTPGGKAPPPGTGAAGATPQPAAAAADPEAPAVAAPALFSLLHPLDELKPVCWAEPLPKTAAEATVTSCVGFVGQTVLHANGRLPVPLVVTVDSAGLCVSALCPRKSTSPAQEHLAPDLQLRPIWQGDGPNRRPPDRVFSFVDFLGRATVAMLRPEVAELHAVAVVPGAGPSGRHSHVVLPAIRATDAVPVRAFSDRARPWREAGSGAGATHATPETKELLVLHGGLLSLYCGTERVAGVMVLTEADTGPAVRLRDPVSNRATLETKGGAMVRFAMPFAPSDPTLRACVGAMARLVAAHGTGVERAPASELATRLGCPADAALLVYLRQAYLPISNVGHDEWGCFADAVLSLLDPQLPAAASAPDIPAEAGDWNFLLGSETHRASRADPCLARLAGGSAGAESSGQPTPGSRYGSLSTLAGAAPGLRPHRVSLLHILHAVYEDSKTSVLLGAVQEPLAALLVRFAAGLGCAVFVEHYARDFPNLQVPAVAPTEETASGSQPGRVPDLRAVLLQSLRGIVVPYPALATARPTRSEMLLQMFGCFLDTSAPLQKRSEKVVEAMVEHGLTQSDLECLPFGMSLPLLEALHACRASPPTSWGPAAYTMVGREDLAAQISPHLVDDAAGPPTEPAGAKDKDSVQVDTEVCRLRFGSDLRVKEVVRLLSSSQPVVVGLEQAPEMSDHEFFAEQKTHLLAVSQRTMAIAPGRGLFSLATHHPIITQGITVPALNLTGVGRATRNVIRLEDTQLAAAACTWPHFHNGVAAGLRIAKAGQAKLSTTWIAYHRPLDNRLTDEHAGFLMALGLLGHLTDLSTMSIYDYLTKGHETTSIGLLLGVAAAKRGTMDAGVAKMLSIHVPSLLPVSSAEVDVPPLVQTAALIGVGLLYEGSAHRRIAEVLLAEIGRRAGPGVNVRVDRESYSVAAGLALGMVTLGKGEEAPGLADLHVADQLQRLIDGGLIRSNPLAPDHGANYQIREGDKINISVTAPGAILALGLMYLRTGNRAVHAQLAIPDTQFLLDYIRPDFLLLRVLARSLIMFDDIEASVEWVEGCCPPCVLEFACDKEAPPEDPFSPPVDEQTLRQAYVNLTAGACFAIGLRFAGSASEVALGVLKHFEELLLKVSLANSAVMGAPTLEACLDVVMVAEAMVMAGTGDLRVLRSLRKLRSRIAPDVSFGSHMALHMAIGLLFLGGGSATLGTSNACVASLVAAFFPRYPKTSDDNQHHLQALRHLVVLAAEPRCVVPRDVDTGRAGYVPLLVTPLAPEGSKATPAAAFRVVAPCLLPPVDTIKTLVVDGPRYWPVCLDIAGNPGHRRSLEEYGTIFVKRKKGHLDYKQDPRALRAVVRHANRIVGFVGWPTTGEGARRGLAHDEHDDHQVGGIRLARSLAANPTAMAFAKYVCGDTESDGKADATRPIACSEDLPTFCLSVLQECLAEEKSEIEPTYIAIYQTVLAVGGEQGGRGSPLSVVAMLRELLMVLGYYEAVGTAHGTPRVSPTFLSSVRARIDARFDAWLAEPELPAALASFLTPGRSGIDSELLGWFVAFHGLPPSRAVMAAARDMPPQQRHSEPAWLLRLSRAMPGLSLRAATRLASHLAARP